MARESQLARPVQARGVGGEDCTVAVGRGTQTFRSTVVKPYHTAQQQDPTPDDVKALNKRLRWQMDSQDRGLTFIPLDLSTARPFVFVDGSFAKTTPNRALKQFIDCNRATVRVEGWVSR